MANLFWEPFVDIESIKIKIEEQGLKEKEKIRLLDLVHQTFHLRVLDLVLSHLPKEKQTSFLDQYCQLPHSYKLLESIKQDIADIEEKLKLLDQQLKSEVLEQLLSSTEEA